MISDDRSGKSARLEVAWLTTVGVGVLLLCACSQGGAGVDAQPVKRFFTTRGMYDGPGVGGLDGADAKCNLAALSGDLGGTWVAWLSDSTTDAIDRIPDAGPWYLVNGYTLVFPGKESLAGNPIAHLPMDEDGEVLTQDGLGRYVWTGTVRGGTRGAHCADWTDDSLAATATIGDLRTIDRGWTEAIEPSQETCNLVHHLYCFEQ